MGAAAGGCVQRNEQQQKTVSARSTFGCCVDERDRDAGVVDMKLQAMDGTDVAEIEAEMHRLRQQVAKLQEQNEALELEVAASMSHRQTHMEDSAKPSPPKRRAVAVSPRSEKIAGISGSGSSRSSSMPLTAKDKVLMSKTTSKERVSSTPATHLGNTSNGDAPESRVYDSAARAFQEVLGNDDPHQVGMLRRVPSMVMSASPIGRHLLPLTLQRVEPPLLPDTVPVALLFPNQTPNLQGMLKGVAPRAQELLRKASALLGYDLEQLCIQGSVGKRKLDDTINCQPAVYVAGLAAVERLKLEHPQAVDHCQAVAGFGVGEYAALQVAGVFSFEEGLELVKVRAEEMHKAAQQGEQRQLLLTGVELDRARMLCEEARRKACIDGEHEVCSVAYAVIPKGHICAGTEAAANELYKLGRSKHSGVDVRARFMETRKDICNGAFQTQLMDEAQRKLREALRKMLPKMKAPKCAVYFNTMGEALPAGADPSLIVDLLARQLTSTVLWEQTIRTMIREGVDEFIVCGPSTYKQLQDIMWKISSDAGRKTRSCHE